MWDTLGNLANVQAISEYKGQVVVYQNAPAPGTTQLSAKQSLDELHAQLALSGTTGWRSIFTELKNDFSAALAL